MSIDVGIPGSIIIPNGASLLVANSGNVAAAAAVATLTSAAGRTAYLLGFLMMGLGATGASVVAPTITGLLGGTWSMAYSVPAGVTVQGPTLNNNTYMGLPAAASGTNIVVTLPSLGAGNTNATCMAWGYLL